MTQAGRGQQFVAAPRLRSAASIYLALPPAPSGIKRVPH